MILADANPRQLYAYLIVGHPQGDEQDVAAAMQFANNLGIRVMLPEFSPLPGPPDGEICQRRVDLAESLWHNKTAFTMRLLGQREINRLKNLVNVLNRRIITGNLGAPSAGWPSALVKASGTTSKLF